MIQAGRKMLVSEIAHRLGLSFEGDGGLEITGAAPLDSAGPSDISFASGKAIKTAGSSEAGCLVVPGEFENPGQRTVLRADEPRRVFAAALHLLYPESPVEPGIHPTAEIHRTAIVDPSAEVGPRVSIGQAWRRRVYRRGMHRGQWFCAAS
jgi:UDP-3-O-[3-hydroxymyristoyl] glucosamine N-acyltransferase